MCQGRLVGCVCGCVEVCEVARPMFIHLAFTTEPHTPQAVPAGLEMEIALMREERERDKQLKEQ